MKTILTAEIAEYLKGITAVAALVEERIYTKQLPAYRVMPAVAVVKVSQTSADSHSGTIGVYSSIINLFVFARSLAEVEEIKQEINDALDGLVCEEMDGIDPAYFSLINDADYEEYELLEADECAGVLEYECNWSYSE
jgi:hypothetical protein